MGRAASSAFASLRRANSAILTLLGHFEQKGLASRVVDRLRQLQALKLVDSRTQSGDALKHPSTLG